MRRLLSVFAVFAISVSSLVSVVDAKTPRIQQSQTPSQIQKPRVNNNTPKPQTVTPSKPQRQYQQRQGVSKPSYNQQMQGDSGYGSNVQNYTQPKLPKQTFTVNGVSFTMIRVETGTFYMGATEEQHSESSSEKPVHEVTLSSYMIGETEVTQELFEAVMGYNNSSSKNPKYPVTDVSWIDFQKFILKLNSLTGKKFRMPTEAEWEFAARGGNKSEHHKFSGSDNADEVAWLANNSGFSLHEVKTKRPNELGIYDMSGNAWEFVYDVYDINYYNIAPPVNPEGPFSTDLVTYRVYRGGMCRSAANEIRVAYRSCYSDNEGTPDISLRLALPLDE